MGHPHCEETVSRPTDLTPELATALCQLVKDGLPMVRAAEHEGIHYSTFKRWQTRKGEPYEAFSASLKKAKAEAQKQSIAVIRSGAQGWQGEAWYLERSDPKNWGRRMEMKAKVETKDASSEYEKLTPSERAEWHRKAAAEEEAKHQETRH